MKIIGSDLKWSSAVAVSVVAILCVIFLVMRFVVPRFKRIQTLNDGVNRVTKEGIEGIRVVHAYNAEGYQQRRFKDLNDELVDTRLGEWAYQKFDTIPARGDSFRYHDLLITVSEMDHNRIRKLKIVRMPEPAEGGQEA